MRLTRTAILAVVALGALSLLATAPAAADTTASLADDPAAYCDNVPPNEPCGLSDDVGFSVADGPQLNCDGDPTNDGSFCGASGDGFVSGITDGLQSVDVGVTDALRVTPEKVVCDPHDYTDC
jgi:hypothetical protein